MTQSEHERKANQLEDKSKELLDSFSKIKDVIKNATNVAESMQPLKVKNIKFDNIGCVAQLIKDGVKIILPSKELIEKYYEDVEKCEDMKKLIADQRALLIENANEILKLKEKKKKSFKDYFSIYK